MSAERAGTASEVGDVAVSGSALSFGGIPAVADPGAALSVNVVYPEGAGGLKELALSATNNLTINHDAVIATTNPDVAQRKPAKVASLRAPSFFASTYIADRVRVGSVWSGPTVNVGPLAVIDGDVESRDQVNLVWTASVTGEIRETVPIPERTFTRKDTLPTTPATTNTVLPGQTKILAPGYYGPLTVWAGGTVRLSAGVYYFERFKALIGSQVRIDNAAGPTVIYIGREWVHQGTVTELAPDATYSNVLWPYLGTANVDVLTPLVGTILATKARVNLGTTVLSNPHRGAVFAKEIVVPTHSTFLHAPFRSWLGADLEVSATSVCSGQTIDVEVVVDSQLTDDVTVTVLDNPGPSHKIQMNYRPGTSVPITARVVDAAGTVSDVLVQEVAILDCPAAPPKPAIVARAHFGEDAHAVELQMANITEMAATPGATYVWSFGDGTTQTTPLPFVVHSYRDHVSAVGEYQQFEVSLTVVDPGKVDAVGTRTVTMWNHYALSKQRGRGQLPTKANHVMLFQWGPDFLGTFNVRNVELTAVTLTDRTVLSVPCGDAGLPQQVLSDTVDIDVAPGESLDSFALLSGTALSGACSVQVIFDGTSASGVPVRAMVTWDHPGGLVERQEIVSAEMNNLLNAIVDAGLSESDTVVTESELRALVASGIANYPLQDGVPPISLADPVTIEEELGTRCAVGDTPFHSGLYCKPTGTWQRTRGQIANAVKGDVVLSKGCGFIHKLMSKLQPVQIYTHMGIMTKNRTEIRQSTSNEEFLNDNPDDPFMGSPTDGFKEAALRFGWPGAITSEVSEAMVYGKVMIDPQGNRRVIKGFQPNTQQCSDNGPVVYPLVVKPPPEEETSAVRGQLHAAANAAVAMTAHYRYFAYSDATIADPAGPHGTTKFAGPSDGTAGWAGAGGVVPTVCSSFVWRALKNAGIVVDGFRPPTDTGDTIDLSGNPTSDGVFFYTEEERRAAGEALLKAFREKVAQKVEQDYPLWLVEAFSDVQDDIAHQVVNCFAFDDCHPDAKDDEDSYKNPGTGIAVAPDDIWRNYDKPSDGGVYGYSEEMIYREGWFEQIHEWAVSEGTGTLTGQVTKNGTPEAGARVYVQVQDASGNPEWVHVLTDSNGEFSRVGVYAGNVSLLADSAPELNGPGPEDDEYFSADKCTPAAAFPDCDAAGNAIVPAGGTAHVLIELEGNGGNNSGGNDLAQSDAFRRVNIRGGIFVLEEDACWYGGDCDETGTWNYDFDVLVGPGIEQAQGTFASGCPDDETKGQLIADVKLLNMSGRVEVKATLKLYEDDHCGLDDEDGKDDGRIELAGGGPTEGEQRPLFLCANHDDGWEPFSDDSTSTTMTARNIWRAECTSDAECTAGTHCSDPSGGFCVECAADAQCMAGQVCSQHECVQCSDDSHCAVGQTCVAQTCIP